MGKSCRRIHLSDTNAYTYGDYDGYANGDYDGYADGDSNSIRYSYKDTYYNSGAYGNTHDDIDANGDYDGYEARTVMYRLHATV